MNPTPAATDRAPIPLRKGIVKQVIFSRRDKKSHVGPEKAQLCWLRVFYLPTHNFLSPTFIWNPFWFHELKL